MLALIDMQVVDQQLTPIIGHVAFYLPQCLPASKLGFVSLLSIVVLIALFFFLFFCLFLFLFFFCLFVFFFLSYTVFFSFFFLSSSVTLYIVIRALGCDLVQIKSYHNYPVLTSSKHDYPKQTGIHCSFQTELLIS